MTAARQVQWENLTNLLEREKDNNPDLIGTEEALQLCTVVDAEAV